MILGDSGYPIKPWLMVPFPNPNNEAERNFNYAHTHTRVKVECAIGLLKRRFAYLHQEIRLSPGKACQMVMVGAMLHNIAIDRLDNTDNLPPLPPAANLQAPQVVDPQEDQEAGRRERRRIADTFFRQ